MAYLLHIDTSTDTGTIAVSKDGQVLTLLKSEEQRNHAAAINVLIAQSLKNAGVSMDDISAVVVCAGPGSYTGLRIAMATAKGICYANDRPLILNNKLSLIANAIIDKEEALIPYSIASIIAAREKEYYLSIYNNKHVCLTEPKHVTEDEMLELLKESENLHIISDVPSQTFYYLKVNFLTIKEDITIDYNCWAKYAYNQYKCQEFVNLAVAAPFYLKQVYTHK